jgi:hypothetical protein
MPKVIPTIRATLTSSMYASSFSETTQTRIGSNESGRRKRLSLWFERDLRDLHPRDMIDIQSFLRIEGSDEYPD